MRPSGAEESDDADELDRRFDLIVIGAGITGVHIAREAALRGVAVLLVDRSDIGAGTSSATTKYLHGGIRYLEQYEVGVVRDSLRERRIATLSAPHLVRQTRFLLPVWSWSRPGRWMLSAGAAAYDALAFDRNREAPDALRIGHPRWLGAGAARRAVPWLDPDGLRGAVAITDTLNVHPERLLLEFALDAMSAGAVVRTYTEVTGFVSEGTEGPAVRIDGVELRDRHGRRRVARAPRVVNAAGPWMGEVLARLTATTGRAIGPRVFPSKGVHLLTRPVDDGVTDAVMARARNGRHVVVSPWQGRSFIGPTDTPVEVGPDDVSAGPDDVDELLAIVNSCRHGDAQLRHDDVDDVTVGIRPLVMETGGDSYSSSRRHEVHDHATEGAVGLWSVAGGKWTTGRAIAEDVIARVVGATGPSPTRRRGVPGAPGWATEPATLLSLGARAASDRGVPLPADVAEHLSRLYGARVGSVIEVLADDPRLAERVSRRPGCHDVLAQVVVAVRDEFASTLADIVDRRLVLGTLGPVPVDELARVAAVAAPLLGWSDAGNAEVGAEAARRSHRRALWSG